MEKNISFASVEKTLSKEKLEEFFEIVEVLQKKAKYVKDISKSPPVNEKKMRGSLDEFRSLYYDDIKKHVDAICNGANDVDVTHHVKEYIQLMKNLKSGTLLIYKKWDEAKQIENKDLGNAIEEFNIHLSSLEQFCKVNGCELPWQLKYAAERSGEDGQVEFDGGVICDADGKPIWEVRCYLCHVEIEHGSYGAGSKRYHCQECNAIDECEQCHNLSIRTLLLSKYSNNQDLLKIYEHFDPHLRHELVAEYFHPVWLHLETLKGNTPAKLIHNAFKMYENRPCLGKKNQTTQCFEWITYKELGNKVKYFAYGLKNHLNIPERSFVGICARNCEEWMVSDFAFSTNHYVSVGVHTTYDSNSLRFVIDNADLCAIVCDLERLQNILAVIKGCPKLKYIIVMDGGIEKDDSKNIQIIAMSSLIAKAEEEFVTKDVEFKVDDQIPSSIGQNINAPPDLYTIMYTSGSTGSPKGTMITYDMFTYDVSHALYISPLVTASYIPLSHSTDRMRIYETILNGGRIGFADYHPRNWVEHESGLKKASTSFSDSFGSTNGVEELINDVKLLQPTIFIAPPRIWNGIYEIYNQLLSQQYSDKHAREEVIAKCLGERVKCLATGGAPTSPVVAEFIRSVFPNCSFNESYGATECGGISMDGVIMNDVQVKLIDLPEHGYNTNDDPNPRGELAVKSRTVAAGYYKLPQETAVSFHNGWFYTGDICEIDKTQGTLKVLGRKKAIFKLCTGKTYDPDYLELFYQEKLSHLISQICILGQADWDFIVAIVIPNRNCYLQYSNDIKQLKTLIVKSIEESALEANLPPFKSPKYIILETSKEFCPQNGLLTTSFKVMRDAIFAEYRDQILALISK